MIVAIVVAAVRVVARHHLDVRLVEKRADQTFVDIWTKCATHALRRRLSSVPFHRHNEAVDEGSCRANIAAIETSRPLVVVDADDVVLAEISAGLHLDQFEQYLARVLQPVRRPIGM